MLKLSHEQLLAARDWLPLAPGYGREEPKLIVEVLQPIVHGLRGRHWLGVIVEADGGLENFAHVFVYDSQVYPLLEEDLERRATRYLGVSIYLSLLGPYAAIAPSRQHMSYDKKPVGGGLGAGAAPAISLAHVADAAAPDDAVMQAAFNEVHARGYRILTREELSCELPPDIKPMDPCGLGPPPYTYFDLLFNRTD